MLIGEDSSTDIKESLKHIQVAEDADVILNNFNLGCPVPLVHVEPAAGLSHTSKVVLYNAFFRGFSVR